MDEGWKMPTRLLVQIGIYQRSERKDGGCDIFQSAEKKMRFVFTAAAPAVINAIMTVFASTNIRSSKVRSRVTLIKLPPTNEMISRWKMAPRNRQAVWNSSSLVAAGGVSQGGRRLLGISWQRSIIHLRSWLNPAFFEEGRLCFQHPNKRGHIRKTWTGFWWALHLQVHLTFIKHLW